MRRFSSKYTLANSEPSAAKMIDRSGNRGIAMRPTPASSSRSRKALTPAPAPANSGSSTAATSTAPIAITAMSRIGIIGAMTLRGPPGIVSRGPPGVARRGCVREGCVRVRGLERCLGGASMGWRQG
jgi:hypothetical protein